MTSSIELMSFKKYCPDSLFLKVIRNPTLTKVVRQEFAPLTPEESRFIPET